MDNYKKWGVDNVVRTDEGKVIAVKLIDNICENKSVSFKWDGCIDLRKYYNGYTVNDNTPEADKDYIHICDLQEYIDELKEILNIAKDVLDKDDYNEYYR